MNSTQRKPRLGPWQAIGLFILLWAVIMAVGQTLRSALLPYVSLKTPRDIVVFRMAVGLPLSWLALGGTVLLLRVQGQRLPDIGWGRRAAIWGWLLAAILVAFSTFSSFRSHYCHGLCFIDPALWLSDWSPFRIAMAVAIGFTAGICEETMFRGFVMTEAKAGRAPVWIQIVLSGVLFGAAHFGIGGLGGSFNWAAALGAAFSTTIFGCLFAVVYLLARRSLTPGIVGHGLYAFIIEPWMLLFVLGSVHFNP
jgi:membrane protease YdiL (CAAX protease family)